MKKIRLVLLALIVVFGCVGCDESTTVEKSQSVIEGEGLEIEAETDIEMETAIDKEIATNYNETRIITDMAGREVVIPQSINKVFSRCPIGTIIMYSLNPEKIAGLNWEPVDVEREYLCESYLELPMLSGWYGTVEQPNPEEIIKAAPDIIFSSGTESVVSIDQANSIQEQLNIPVVVINTELENLDEMYTFVGELIGEETRAEVLSAYITEVMDDVKTKAASIQEEDKITVYYAEGTEGLTTDPSGSAHSELIDLVGGINIADVEITSGMGRTEVSIEQLATWQPDMILACHDQGFANTNSTYKAMINDSRLEFLDAISSGNIYEIPYKPFNIFDRPPSVNRIIGIKWVANLLYPEVYEYDIENDFKEFYALFYNIELTNEEIEDILGK
jgi:iron complex transport system substrate-binding protein